MTSLTPHYTLRPYPFIVSLSNLSTSQPETRIPMQVLEIVQQRDALAEGNLLTLLIEDRHATVVSYIDFLCHIHSQIQQKLA